jgi:cardiolipin synthase
MKFSESRASSVETLVEGSSFYPRMLEDIASASSSVHINQFGFRPGIVGDVFAETLIAKAAEGVPVRLVVDAQGSNPERGPRAFYERLTSAGIQVCVVRATKPRVLVGPLGGSTATKWNLGGLAHIDHRKVAVIDGGIGWVVAPESRIISGRSLPRFVRAGHRPRGRAAPACLRQRHPLARR